MRSPASRPGSRHPSPPVRSRNRETSVDQDARIIPTSVTSNSALTTSERPVGWPRRPRPHRSTSRGSLIEHRNAAALDANQPARRRRRQPVARSRSDTTSHVGPPRRRQPSIRAAPPRWRYSSTATAVADVAWLLAHRKRQWRIDRRVSGGGRGGQRSRAGPPDGETTIIAADGRGGARTARPGTAASGGVRSTSSCTLLG